MTNIRENKMIGFRPANKLRKLFAKKCKAMHNTDGYTTQNKVLIELLSMWVFGKVKIPGETKWINGIKVKS